MSKADKMFEELGFRKTFNKIRYESFEFDDDLYIVSFDHSTKNIILNEEYNFFVHVDIKLLKAINNKLKELGWLDE